MAKTDIPPDAITTKGVRLVMQEASETNGPSAARARDRIRSNAFSDAVKEHTLADGTRVYSEAEVRAYVDPAKAGWSAK